MSRRIEVELTSARDDGTWTWRAAGAKQPKGVLSTDLLYEGAAVGDVCRIEAEMLLDGIEVTEVFPPKTKKGRTDLLELKPRSLRDDELVTTTRVAREDRGRGGKDGRRDGRGGKRDGGRRDGGRHEGDRGRGRGDSESRGRGPRQSEQEVRPKAKRLRPRRVHRDAVLAEVPDEHRPIAEQVIKGGIAGVRSAIDKQNTEAKEAGTPEIAVEPVLAIAEDLIPKLRSAEWRDRADAAIADLAELDLRDLRSVVVAADSARDDESKALAEQLRTGLNERIEHDHQQWLSDIQESVDAGRSVRALRLSSRPVKAGAPLPSELASRLSDMAAAGLAADAGQDRWATVVDAVAYSPIRNAVTPVGYPEEPTKELLDAVRRVADRVPAIAAHFGIDPSEATKAKRRRPARKTTAKGEKKGAGDKKASSGKKGADGKSASDGAAKKAEPKKQEEKSDATTTDESKSTEPSTEKSSAVSTDAESKPPVESETTSPEVTETAAAAAEPEAAPEPSAEARVEAEAPADAPAEAEPPSEAVPETPADAEEAKTPADAPVEAETPADAPVEAEITADAPVESETSADSAAETEPAEG